MEGKPYFFDEHVFEEDGSCASLEVDAPPAPEFTADELAAAKAAAFEEGRKAGLKQSEEELTQKALNVLQKIDRDIAVLIAAEADRAETLENEAVVLALSVMRKVFPAYTEKFGLDEIKSSITTSLQNFKSPENIQIEVHSDLAPKIEGLVKKLEQDLHKHITLRPSTTLAENSCQIQWPDGGIICNRTEIAEKTVNLIQDALAERGVSRHDEAESVQSSETTEDNAETIDETKAGDA